MGVRRRERVGDLRGDRERARRLERRLARDQVRERLALEVLHREVEIAAGRPPEVGHLDDVLMPDAVDGRRLVDEAGDDVGVARVLRVNDLERRLAPDDGMLREKNRTHPAFTELGYDAVVAFGSGKTTRVTQPAWPHSVRSSSLVTAWTPRAGSAISQCCASVS